MYGRNEDRDARLREEGERFLISVSRREGSVGNSIRRTNYEEFTHFTCRDAGVREFRLPAELEQLSSLLDDISRKSFEKYDGIMLSALVWRKGRKAVGPGFWTLATQLGKVPANLNNSSKPGKLQSLAEEVNRYFTPEDGEANQRDESPSEGENSAPAAASPVPPTPSPTPPHTAEGEEEVSAGPGRAGRLTDFVPEKTPKAPFDPVPAAWVDPKARDEATERHHDAVRRLRGVAQAADHQTKVWDVGQDVAFLVNGVLVNAEVKTIGDDESPQLRLGVGQLLEQLEHHRAHMVNHSPWYVEAEVKSLAGVLILVGPTKIPPIWARLAQRAGFALWTCETAEQEFAKEVPSLMGLTRIP